MWFMTVVLSFLFGDWYINIVHVRNAIQNIYDIVMMYLRCSLALCLVVWLLFYVHMDLRF